MNGTMSSNLQFGFWAQVKLEVSTSTELFDIPLGPVTVPGLFDIGPCIVVMAEASASIATAVATVGIKMPIMLGFAVNLLKGWVLEQDVVSETPSVSLSARYAGQVRVNDKEKWAGVDGTLDTDKGFTCPNKIVLFGLHQLD
ncbi:uncharacterized protein DFL_004300 [Arthrobotrys flagrans]|uniref:DUF7223 domain-containing protein n=1 Tax=Arthrobotrys flagrans TaxID=97331 RepID=A0A437A4C6_ARTFL|nr:hypothetical protein DFL_004300 [Arthrobotrys flagrans]